MSDFARVLPEAPDGCRYAQDRVGRWWVLDHHASMWFASGPTRWVGSFPPSPMKHLRSVIVAKRNRRTVPKS